MLSKLLTITSGLLCSALLLANAGCSSAEGNCFSQKTPCKTPCKTSYKAPCKTPCKTEVAAYQPPRGQCDRSPGEVAAELPPNARSGECYAKVFVPATYRTVSERVLVRDASEKIEIIPARYEWVEERILVKDASKELQAIPAEFSEREETIQTAAAHTDWEINKNDLCVNPKEQPARDVFCLVDHQAVQTKVLSQRQVSAARVQEVCIPAEYETVRRQKLVSAATTRKTCIAAEYDTIEKTIKVCDGRMAWQRVVCEVPEKTAISMNR